MKDEILQTSLKQFLRYGIREMSIHKLVAPLGISTKTVYKYFDNKEQLLEEALTLYYVQQYSLLEAYRTDKYQVSALFNIWYLGLETECKTNKAFFHDLNYYYPELERKVETTISKKIWKRFVEIIENGKMEGFFRNEIDPEIALEAISSIYVSVARTVNFKKFKNPLSGIFLNTIAVFIRGFCTPKGVKALDAHIDAITKLGKISIPDALEAGSN